MYSLEHLAQAIMHADRRVSYRIAALEIIRASGPISRTEIAARLKTSLPTAIRIVDGLAAEGLVGPSDQKAWSGGRRPELVEFQGQQHQMIGIDLGGTKIHGAVANLNGEFLFEKYYQHHQSQAEESFAVLCDSIDDLLRQAQLKDTSLRGISVGVPGSISPQTGSVSHAPGLGWRDFPLQKRLVERYATPVDIENDVNLSAEGEFWFGTQPGQENLALVAIGTGIGAGFILNGRLHTGAHSMAGEIGYLLPERECLRQTYPGSGAFEQAASGTGIAAQARLALAGVWDDARLSALTAEDVFIAARENERWAVKVVEETIDFLAQAVASITMILDPDVIILAGGVSRSADLLIDPILDRLEGVIPIRPNMIASHLGSRAGILGGVSRLLHLAVRQQANPDHA